MAGGANEHQSVNRFQSIPDAGHNDFTKKLFKNYPINLLSMILQKAARFPL